ncbi:hypothetical protein TREVI0001_2077 [Treponema vincentii ATCC 35580]|uniref:Uncharacterized protein n=1 Tax=Treponema vincentii ATCC 35580 TaxID=596324 RepID=C8PQH3_9SPIR|nr:hypothetical protein TREVI0001_2077 [Treponema vincentii ATCC 35580]
MLTMYLHRLFSKGLRKGGFSIWLVNRNFAVARLKRLTSLYCFSIFIYSA